MKADMKMRFRVIAKKEKLDTNLDRKHVQRLRGIIRKYGWLTKSLVGRRASHAAWLITQHSPSLKFQRKSLKEMEKIYQENKNEINPANIAFLKDRILIKEKKLQIFGTQFQRNKKGELEPFPIKDREGLSKRRRKYGLPTLAQNTREINQAYGK